MLKSQFTIRQIRAQIPSRLFLRKYSATTGVSLQDQLSKLKAGNNVPPTTYLQLLQKDELINGQRVEMVDEIIGLAKNNPKVTRDDLIHLHNFVLKTLIQHDTSLSTIHQRELSTLNGEVDIEALVQIIKYNSGRNKSSWEILLEFEKYVGESQELLETVITKLLYGDASEQEDGYKVNETGLIRSVFLLKNLQNPSPKLVHDVLAECLESERYDLIQIVGLESLDQIKSLEPNSEQLVKLWDIWNPKSLSEADIDGNIPLLQNLIWKTSGTETNVQEVDDSLKKNLKELQSQFPKLDATLDIDLKTDFSMIFQKLVELLERSNTLSAPKQIYSPLREALLKAYGMNKLDYKHSLKLYHDFIVLDKANVDSLMSTMMKIALYVGVQNNDPQQLLIAQALVPQPMTVNSLQALILGNSAFDLEKSLELFNSSIKHLSKEINEEGVSAAGLVTESLLISYLSKRDREFAYLIHDGAIMNELVTSETGKDRMKAIFKRYGEIVGEEDDDKINKLLKDEVLKALKEL